MTDYILVKRETLQAAAESLGSFCSDHGWSQQDMDNMDSLFALLAAPCEPDAWFEHNPSLDAWFLAYSENQKVKTRPLFAPKDAS